MWEGVKLSWVITTSEKELVEQKVGPRLALVSDYYEDGITHCEAVQCVVGCVGFLWVLSSVLSRLHFCL